MFASLYPGFKCTVYVCECVPWWYMYGLCLRVCTLVVHVRSMFVCTLVVHVWPMFASVYTGGTCMAYVCECVPWWYMYGLCLQACTLVVHVRSMFASLYNGGTCTVYVCEYVHWWYMYGLCLRVCTLVVRPSSSSTSFMAATAFTSVTSPPILNPYVRGWKSSCTHKHNNICDE